MLTSQHPRHGPHNVDEAHEQEVFRRIARKYGFCETCGMERSPKEVYYMSDLLLRCVSKMTAFRLKAYKGELYRSYLYKL